MEINLKHNNGYCVICEKKATFIEHNDWLRDHYLCSTCNSIPRQRALIHALHTFFPKWDSYNIHESSPGGITTQLLLKNCKTILILNTLEIILLANTFKVLDVRT